MNSPWKKLAVGFTAVGAAALVGCANRTATSEDTGTGGSGTEVPSQTPPDPGQDTTEYPGSATEEGSMGGADTGMPEGPGTPSDATPSDNTGTGGSGAMGEEGATGQDDTMSEDPIHTDDPAVEPTPGTDSSPDM